MAGPNQTIDDLPDDANPLCFGNHPGGTGTGSTSSGFVTRLDFPRVVDGLCRSPCGGAVMSKLLILSGLVGLCLTSGDAAAQSLRTFMIEMDRRLDMIDRRL